MSWLLYILECQDKTLYTGITTDLSRRVEQHNKGTGAKYTRSRGPVHVLASWPYPDRSEASRAEAEFKKLSRKEKLVYIHQPTTWGESCSSSTNATASDC